MIKKGFTLAEIVVTLGIVGIITAITAPSLMNLMPDKNKVEVLKAYKYIHDATTELIEDPGFYTTNGVCIGIGCTAQPNRSIPGEDMTKYTGTMKYPRLLCHKMQSDGCNVSATQVTFTTPDGIDWTITSGNKITIDINGADAPNKVYTKSYTKKDIDRYEFNINNRGYITGNDPLTKAYLANRDKLNDKIADYDNAKKKY